jgi:uncharacterized protein (TIGR03000 family)
MRNGEFEKSTIMNRNFGVRVCVTTCVALAFLCFAPFSIAQHGGGGGHGGGGHGGGGHSGSGHVGGSSGGGGGAYHGGYQRGFSSGYYRDDRHEFNRDREFRHFYGGYPNGFWGGYYPEFYYAPDYYYPSAPSYGYYPQYSESPVVVPPVAADSWPQLDQRVTARISVPTEDAQLWIEGEEMSGQGSSRLFVSPPLEPGKYTYYFRSRWSENGKTMDRTKKVKVQPGDRISVDFRDEDTN